MTPTPKPKNLEEVIEKWLKENRYYEPHDRYFNLAEAVAKATIEAIVPEGMNDKRLGKKNRYLNNYSFIFNQCLSEMKKRAGEWVREDNK